MSAVQASPGEENMFDQLQYRILKRIAPGEPSHMSGAAYKGRSKVEVLLGPAILERIRGKTVLDYGCGDGETAVDLAQRGATRVIGLDIRESILEKAAQRTAAAGVQDRCHLTTNIHEPVDAIISLDAFEHFADPQAELERMYALLRPGGFLAAAFGPTWYHPLGGHLVSVFPWAHLIFSEKALMRWRADLRSDGAKRFSELPDGLNQMTIHRFERLVAQSGFRTELFETRPIRRLRLIHNRFTREFTTSFLRCLLVKA